MRPSPPTHRVVSAASPSATGRSSTRSRTVGVDRAPPRPARRRAGRASSPACPGSHARRSSGTAVSRGSRPSGGNQTASSGTGRPGWRSRTYGSSGCPVPRSSPDAGPAAVRRSASRASARGPSSESSSRGTHAAQRRPERPRRGRPAAATGCVPETLARVQPSSAVRSPRNDGSRRRDAGDQLLHRVPGLGGQRDRAVGSDDGQRDRQLVVVEDEAQVGQVRSRVQPAGRGPAEPDPDVRRLHGGAVDAGRAARGSARRRSRGRAAGPRHR